MNYYSIITNEGLISHTNAVNNSVNLNLTKMAIGDSNGTDYNPDGTETALVNEIHRVNLTHVVIDENNPNQLIVEAILDETVGPFYIREVGIFDSNGTLFAIGKYPETFKPNLPTGSGKRLYIRMILGFSNSPNVNLVINNDISLDPNFSKNVNDEIANINSELTTINNRITQVNSVPTGAVFALATTNILSGYLECNGAQISRSTYSDLFNIIGTQFGAGNGSTTFNIPDLRGEFIRGVDNGRGIDNSRSLGSQQNQDWKSFNMWNSYGATYSYTHDPVYMQKHTSNPGNIFDLFGGHWASPSGRLGLYWDNSEIRPRNIALLMCIKY